MQQRLTTCMGLLIRYGLEPFLDRIITGDEKWVLYVNVVRKQQWVHAGCAAQPVPKPSLYLLKVMMCVWWSIDGIVYYELLPTDLTITADE